jgi:acyl-CoA hydrolase
MEQSTKAVNHAGASGNNPSLKAIISSARSIYASGAAAEIRTLPDLLREHSPNDAVVTGIFTPPLNSQSYADPTTGVRMRSFFLLNEIRRHTDLGLIEYCPWRYGTINRWMLAPDRFDTAMVMLSPPDASGRCSLGVQTDFFPRFRDQVKRIVGFINPNMPRTHGEGEVTYDELDAVVDCDAPLNVLTLRPPDEAARRIAALVAARIPDGATVQVGIGQIPSQVIASLVNHQRLRIHSGVVDDTILLLEESGALDRDVPIVTGTAVGTPAIYAAVDDNPRFSFRAVSYTHSYRSIVTIQGFHAVNSVLQVDLFGQVSAESSNGRLVASPGGFPDFARGALDSPNGRSIIAVRARNAGNIPNGIVTRLDPPGLSSGGALDADVFVTEFGVAEVRDLSLESRAEAIIGIAAPEDRDRLAREWAAIRGGLFVRT